MTVQEVRAIEGSFYQSSYVRFGDYSHMSLDPDGTTFWYTGEYIGQGAARRTRIFSFDMVSLAGTPQFELAKSNLLSYKKGELLYIKMNGINFADELHVELLEMNGKTVRSKDSRIEEEKLEVIWDISSLPKGAYIIAVGGNSFQKTQKIILQ
jgi:hypothetical protein